MNALGRGLASLIPKRNRENAEEMLEQIDSMEEGDSNEKVTVRPLKVESEDEPKTPTPVKTPKAQSGFEDLEQMEDMPMPVKPNVTPLTLDPETGTLKTSGEVMAEAAEVPATKSAKKQRMVITSITETTEVTEKPAETIPEETPTKEPASALSLSESLFEISAPDTPEPAVVVPTDEDIDAVMWDRHEGRVEHIPIGDIEVNPLQPRRDFDPEEMEELEQSLDQHGILQPLVVLRNPGGKYELVAGERRLRAAKKLGWDKVPCVIRTDARTDRGRLEMALIENIQRENLNAVEEAMGYKKLNEEFGLSHEEIGNRVGKSRVAVTNVLRVLQLPAEIQRGLAEGKISPGHARAILMIPDEEKQLKFYNHLLDEGLTVRKAETRARRIQRQMKLSDPLRMKTRGRPILALKYDGLLEERFGHVARVKFEEQKNRFEIIFHAFSEKEAEDLIQRLLGGTSPKVEYPEDTESPDSDEAL